MTKRRVFVAGHRGMVGSAIVRELENDESIELVCRSRNEVDLTDQSAVRNFFETEKIDQVYLAAAKVGGIHANNVYPAEFIYENLIIECNVVDAAYRSGVNNLLLIGSSCIYPKMAGQPMSETELLTGTLEPTNEPYAIAKIAGIKLCESYTRQYGVDYRSIMPTNLYGPYDNFDAENSHVIPALLRRFDEAKRNNVAQIEIWGTGTPMREFLHVSDMARAAVFVMKLPLEIYAEQTDPMLSHINVGTGIDCSIKELAQLIAKVTGYGGEIVFDTSKPDGTPRKLLDVSKLNKLGWSHEIDLESGLAESFAWYVENKSTART